MIIEIVNGINKFLGYLDISPKYLNRAYTLISIFPTLYILRFMLGFYISKQYMQVIIYTIVFLVLSYFIILNILYYFFDKNVKWDITQLFVKHLPDEVFNIVKQEEEAEIFAKNINGETIPIELVNNSNIILTININKLIEQNKINYNNLNETEGYLIPKNTLYPYYTIEPDLENKEHYTVLIGTDYQDLTTIGHIYTNKKFTSLGLYILGGNFRKDSIDYKEPFNLKLIAKINDDF